LCRNLLCCRFGKLILEGSSMRFFLVLLGLSFAMVTVTGAEDQLALNLMPVPAHVQTNSGQLAVDASFTIAISGHNDARMYKAADRFLDQLRRQTGMVPLGMKVVEGSSGSLVVHVDHASKEIPELGEDESYKLEVTSSGAKLDAPTTLGALRGLQTFRQL